MSLSWQVWVRLFNNRLEILPENDYPDGREFPSLLVVMEFIEELWWKSARFVKRWLAVRTGVIPVIRFLSALRRVVRPPTIVAMPRSVQNAVSSSRTISLTARCIVSVPSAKRNRGFPIPNASIVAIGLIARAVDTRCLRPACSLAHVVPQVCAKFF